MTCLFISFLTLFCVCSFVKLDNVKVDNDLDLFWKEITPEEVQIKQSKSMQNYLNKSVNPCEDFYQYACGNWLKFAPNPTARFLYSVHDLRAEKLDSSTNSFIATFYDPDLNNQNHTLNQNNEIMSAEKKLKVYYTTCINEIHKNQTDFNDFLEIFESLHSTPLWNSNWKSEEFNWLKLAVFAEKFKISTLFEFSTKYIFSPIPVSFSYYRDEEAQEFYKKYIENILKISGVDTEKAKKSAKEILEFEIKLFDIGWIDDEILSIDDFIKENPEVNWRSYLSDIFDIDENNLNVSQTITFRTNIKNITDLIKKSGPEIVANFMMWKIFKDTIHAFDSRYRNEYIQYQNNIGGFIGSYNPERVCDINSDFKPIAKTLYLQKYYQINEEYFNNIITELRESLLDDINKLHWLEDYEKDLVIDYLKNFKIEITPSPPYSVERLNSAYSEFKVIPNKYLLNYLNSQYFSEKYALRRHDVGEFSYSYSFYNSTTNVIHISVGYLLPINYHPEFSNALNLGGLGTSLAEHIIRGIPFIDDYDPPSFVDDRASDLVECYRKIQNIEDPSSYKIYYQNSVITKTFDIYEKWLTNKNFSVEKKLPEFDATPKQLFFLNYIQNRCVFHNRKLFRNDDITLALANHKGFADAFSCPIDSQMNPKMKCENIL